MRNPFRWVLGGWALILAVIFGSMSSAYATVPTELTDLVTDATSFFGSVKTLVLSVVVFFILLGFASLIKRKK